MAAQPAAQAHLECALCGARHAPGAIVCEACGGNLEQLRQVLPRARAAARQQDAEHRAALEQAARPEIREASAAGRRHLVRQVTGTLVVATALAGVVVAGIAWYGGYVRDRQAWTEAQHVAGAACLASADFVCARDRLQVVLRMNPAYPGAHDELRTARLGLAEQLVRAAQWRPAVEELDAVLRDRPADSQALDAVRRAYDGWLADAAARGDAATAANVRRARDARFPPPPTPAAPR